MNAKDAERLQSYLRKRLGNNRLQVASPRRAGSTAELKLGDEVLGTVHRDEEEGEVSFAIHLIVLEEDLASTA